MDDDPGASVRKKKDSSLVRAAELVRDGVASAMVSAGNTGATMASALLAHGPAAGRASPLHRDADPQSRALADGSRRRRRERRVHAGDARAVRPDGDYLRQGATTTSSRPRVGLLSIGEEATKGTPLVKATHELLSALSTINFVGNVEGRDLMPSPVDVVVTDGFTGNVALKTLEGALGFIFSTLLSVDRHQRRDQGRRRRCSSNTCCRLPSKLTPETQGGALLLGVNGICVISHGSSNATAIMNALRVAAEMDDAQVVAEITLNHPT